MVIAHAVGLWCSNQNVKANKTETMTQGVRNFFYEHAKSIHFFWWYSSCNDELIGRKEGEVPTAHQQATRVPWQSLQVSGCKIGTTESILFLQGGWKILKHSEKNGFLSM